MQGAPIAQHQIIGHVDQSADRPLPHRLQPALQPGGRRPVLHAPDHPPVESRAALGIVDDDLDGTGVSPRNHRRLDGLKRAEPRRRQVAGDAVHAHRVLPVRRDGDVDHRIVQLRISGEARPHRRVRGQLDDPVMLVAKLQLADRAHHAAALDAADRRHFQGQVAARHIGARRAEHALESRPRIGRAADHLDGLAGAGIDGQHLELVRLRVRRCGQDLADHEGCELLGGILDALHLEADLGQRLDDGVEIRIRLQMLLQPGQSELHAPTPPLSVGTSSARKP